MSLPHPAKALHAPRYPTPPLTNEAATHVSDESPETTLGNVPVRKFEYSISDLSSKAMRKGIRANKQAPQQLVSPCFVACNTPDGKGKPQLSSNTAEKFTQSEWPSHALQ